VLSTTCARFKYYHAWKFGEAIAISAGFGLIKSENEQKWQYISSVDILGFEVRHSVLGLIDCVLINCDFVQFALNFRECLSAWNITTQGWLRRIAYERVNTYKTSVTYVLSAFWHGFYPGKLFN
jgi:hypothetical protein